MAVSLLAVCDDVEDDEAHRCDGGLDDEGNGRDDGHTRRQSQTPTPLGTADKL